MTFLHCKPGWMWVGKPGQLEEKGNRAREGGERLLSPGQKFNPQPRSAVTESCCLLTPLQQPAGQVDGCPRSPQPWNSRVSTWQAGHISFQLLLRAVPSRLRGHGPQQLCWATRQSQVPLQTPSTLRSSIKPLPQSHSAEEGLSPCPVLPKRRNTWP